MKKISVIGTTGSGKSTFAKRLASKIEARYVQMDQLLWKSHWVESTDAEFLPKVAEAVSGDSWVIDGNYSRTNAIKWQHADTIIWLDFSYSRTLLQLFRRTVTRAISKRELWTGTGNKESFFKAFASKDSIFLWFFKTYPNNKLRYIALMSSPKVQHVNFIRLRNPSEVEQFLLNLNPPTH